MIEFVVPVLVFAAVAFCLAGKVEVYSTFCDGVENGMKRL